jgi:hypothetical protein
MGVSALRARKSEAVWGLLDQALSSATNLTLTLLAARTLGIVRFGGLALAFAGYLVALGLSRAVSSEPLVVRFSGASEASWTAATARSTGSAFLVGFLGGAVMLLAAVFVGGPTRDALVGMAPFMPGLLLQDAWRFAFFAARRGSSAAVNDFIWAVMLAGALVWILGTGRGSVIGFASAWGLSGSIAGLAGAMQARLRPELMRARAWWREHRDLVGRFAAEFGAQIGETQIALYAIGAIGGLAAVGGLRAAQVMLGPLNVLFTGVTLFAVPEGVVRAASSRPALVRLCLWVSGALAMAALAWTMLVLVIPEAVGRSLLAETWGSARSLALAVGLTAVGAGAAAGPVFGLRGLAAAQVSLRSRLAQAVLTVSAATIGVLTYGAAGAAWGLAIASLAGVAIWWQGLWVAIASPRAPRAGGP